MQPDFRAAVRSTVLQGEALGAAKPLADFVAESGGDAVLGVLFFGSRKTGAAPDAYSAFDFFVVTESYRRFYDSLRRHRRLRRGPRLVAGLNAILPPNQVSLSDAVGGMAKCAVIDIATLERETSSERRDHFCAGRLFQPAQLLWSRDRESGERIAECVANAHAATYEWVRPWLPESFDVATFCRTALRVSLGREIRPEPSGRSDALFDAQKVHHMTVYPLLLEELAARGELVQKGEGEYGLTRPVAPEERAAAISYFRRSKIRATERWAKYMVTFDDWLEYIVRKARRHTGEDIALTPREKQWPLVFLWPRFFRFMRHKERKATGKR